MDDSAREVVGSHAATVTIATLSVDGSGAERLLAPPVVVHLGRDPVEDAVPKITELQVEPYPQFVFQLEGFHVAAPNTSLIKQLFDETGRPQRVEFVGAGGDLISTITWSYDGMHKPTRIVQAWSDAATGEPPLSEVEFFYDELRRLSERRIHVLGMTVQTTHYVYGGEHDFPVQERLFYAAGGQTADIHYRYELDHRNNWIARWTLVSSGKDLTATTVVRRHIEYFD